MNPWLWGIVLLVKLALWAVILKRVPWRWPCAFGFHRWSKGSPWREGPYEVRACDRCGPIGGWREFWTARRHGLRDFVQDWGKGGIQLGSRSW